MSAVLVAGAAGCTQTAGSASGAVALTDRNCEPACDEFSGAVKDLRLGTLVGTRTAGIVAGPVTGYLLDDASVLALPAIHQLGARHELINGIGVAPDYYLPLTPQDLSTGTTPTSPKRSPCSAASLPDQEQPPACEGPPAVTEGSSPLIGSQFGSQPQKASRHSYDDLRPDRDSNAGPTA